MVLGFWSPAGAASFQGLGFLPGGSRSIAFGVSSDGAVVVGYNYLPSPPHGEAFRWTEDSVPGGVMEGLGDLPGGEFYSEATGVSADGAVVVGYGKSASGDEAFIWDETHGMRSLSEVLAGLNLGKDLEDWTLNYAWGISADGLTIIGVGINPDGQEEAWRANLAAVPVPGVLLLLGAGLLRLGLHGWRRRRG